MKIIVSYSELSSLVYKKTDKHLTFSFAGYNTLNVLMELSIGFFTASPSLNVLFNSVESNHVYLSLSDTLMGLSKIVDNTIPSLLQQLKCVSLHDNKFDIDLNEIQKLKSMLEIMDLTDISFQNSYIELSFKLH